LTPFLLFTKPERNKYKGKTAVWTIEYSKKIDGHLSELDKKNVAEESKLIIQNCCKIIAAKKVAK